MSSGYTTALKNITSALGEPFAFHSRLELALKHSSA
jgi:hypothetical protein